MAHLSTAIGLSVILAAGPGNDARDAWVEAKTPHFTVVSDGTQKDALRIARQFERFRAALERAIARPFSDERPVLILAVRNEKGLRALLPSYWEQKGGARPGGLFVPGPDRHLIALRTDTDGEHPYRLVFSGYVLALLSAMGRLPLWLSQGFAEYYANTELQPGRVLVGKPSPEVLAQLQEQTLIPVESLLGAGRDSSYYAKERHSQLFHSEAWALVHFLSIGEKGVHTPKLRAYIELVEKGTGQVEAAQTTFGDLQAFQRRLFAYIRSGAFYVATVDGPTTVSEEGWGTRPLPVAEVTIARARLYVATQRLAEAQALLDDLRRVDPVSPAAYDVLGMLHDFGDRPDDAHAAYIKALELGSTSAWTHYAAARLSVKGSADRATYERAARLLEQATTFDNTLAPAYAQLALVEMSLGLPLPRALGLAGRAIEIGPAVSDFVLVAGKILLGMGRLDEAAAFANRALVLAPNDVQRKAAKDLVAQVEDARKK